MLGCLTNETQVLEEVVDLQAELAYQAVTLANSDTSASTSAPLIFPSVFGRALLELRRHPVAYGYPPQLTLLRARLAEAARSGSPAPLAFTVCESGHYMAYYYDAIGSLYVGNSLSPPPSTSIPQTTAEVVDAVNWLLNGLGCPEIEAVKSMGVPRQRYGSQSCGVLAFDGLEHMMGVVGAGMSAAEFARARREEWLEAILTHQQRSIGLEVC